MKKENYFGVGLCLLAGLLLVGALYYYSQKTAYAAHNFKRNFGPTEVVLLKVLDVRYNSYYIAGVSGQNIYLGNHMAPMHLLKVDTMLADTSFISLQLEKMPSTGFTPSVQVKISDSTFYVIDGGIPAIFRGQLGAWKGSRFMYDSLYFIRALPTDSGTFAFFAIGKSGENVLGRLTSTAPHVTIFENYLQKQLDGIFCTDGDLLYNSRSAYLVFLYRYRNDYVIMNRFMQVMHKGKTIDPVNRVRIKPHRLASDSSVTLANPGRSVNKKATLKGNLMYVHSGIRAINDDNRFQNAAVIDIYDLASSAYVESFYLPDYNGKRVRGFVMRENLIVALYDHHLATYRFRKSRMD